MSNELNIYQRINAVMKEVSYIQKNATISGMGAGYKAVTHDQVILAIRNSLVANGIVIEPKQTQGEFLIKRDLTATPPIKMALYAGWYDVSFVNIDKPEERSCVSVEAHANDNGDKAPGKAITYAVKTAMLKMFTLETGENEESRAGDFDTAMKRKLIKTKTDLTKFIQESGYTISQVEEGMGGISFAQIDLHLAFDMVSHWNNQK